MSIAVVTTPAERADVEPSPSPEAPHLALMRATEVFARSLRESGVHLARSLDCSRATLAIIRLIDQRGPLTLGEIAHLLRVDLSVASRQVSLMVTEGYVERAVDHDDRRVRTVALSDAGRARTREIKAELDARTRDVFGDWTEPQMADAVAMLGRLTATIDAASDH
ncbi:MarR family winged helix-turn-helix transcriptional regulator [Cellulomonas edaphi]|uniref:MarR family transcriptional regulator n=1 Tax=Cellulomonas edaphi TaxID=3053468 RepID=A0ABT7S9K7_9CELL|nr:MarR family transcriptional regulator [Cellulomons edaphi]MDM7832307.1 MarR family transcriptional regulator [Cellulomons edaphi]